jgi:AcrR family transcriptional regulator
MSSTSSAEEEEPRQSERVDAAANRRRVLEAATRLFAERGVSAVTTDEVAQAAGVGKGTLFRRFPTRADLCLAVAGARLDALEADVHRRLTAMQSEGSSALNQLIWLLGELLRFNDAHLELLFEAAGAQGPKGKPPLDPQYQLVVTAVANAITTGELADTFTPAVLADLLMAPTRPPMLRLYRSMRGYPLKQIERELELLLMALRANVR